MAQILLPTSDIAAGSWTTTPLWSKVDDDSTVNSTGDGTVITSADNTAPDNADLGLASGTDPSSSTGHILRARWNKNASGGHAINAVLELWQGTPGTGTLIATLTETGITEVETLSEYTLSAGEADSITDYTALNLRVSRQGETGGPPGGRRSLVVDLVEFEVPDAAANARLEVSFAELETPHTPTRIEASFAEVETPHTPTRIEASFAELETPHTPTRLEASFAEMELPHSPTRIEASFAELEVPSLSADARMEVSFAELEVADTPTRLEASFAELEAPHSPTRLEASFAELETPHTPTRIEVSFAELEAPDVARLEASFAEFEVGDTVTRLECSFAEFEVPEEGAVSAAKLALANPLWRRRRR